MKWHTFIVIVVAADAAAMSEKGPLSNCFSCIAK